MNSDQSCLLLKKVWLFLSALAVSMTNPQLLHKAFDQSHRLLQKVELIPSTSWQIFWLIPLAPADILTNPTHSFGRFGQFHLPQTECLSNPAFSCRKFNLSQALLQKAWPVPPTPTERLTNHTYSFRRFGQFHLLPQNLWLFMHTPAELYLLLQKIWPIPVVFVKSLKVQPVPAKRSTNPVQSCTTVDQSHLLL